MNSKIALFAVYFFAVVCSVCEDFGCGDYCGGDCWCGDYRRLRTQIMPPSNKKKKQIILCMGEAIKEDRSLKKTMVTCFGEALTRNPNIADAKKDPCLSACAMAKTSQVKDGKFDVEESKKRVRGKYPSKAVEPINAEIQNCVVANPAPLTLDDKCKSYEPFAKCLLLAIMKVCYAGKGLEATK